MCEASAYVIKDGREEMILESIDLLENNNGEITMTNIFGERKQMKARIKRLSLVDHKIILDVDG